MKVQTYSLKRLKLSRLAAVVLGASLTFAAQAQDSLDGLIQEIDQLIADDQLDTARSRLEAARANDVSDERLDMLERRLKMFDNLAAPSFDQTIETISGAAETSATPDIDRLMVADLLDSLRVALENGELDKVNELSDSSEQTSALLDAVFANYANVTTSLSDIVLDEATESFYATLEFKQLKTFNGDIAYPAAHWNLHELRITKSAGVWQKISW